MSFSLIQKYEFIVLDATIFYLLFYQKTQESMQRIYLPILFYENFFNQILFQAYFFGIVEVFNKKAQSFLFANEGGGEWYGILSYVGMGWDKWHVGMLVLSYVGMLVCWYGMIKWYVVMLAWGCNQMV